MITVENLVKMYGQVAALQGVSFEVPTGQVLGFLGPNGAGKSTTMKILTGYLYATSGSAKVDGIDVSERPLEVRERVGYLPETNPLYTDMRVDDYLAFTGEIRGIAKTELKRAIDRVVSVCGLKNVFKKGIIELSKGFRQRVGLAQAMIHDPQILILDEPTSGLDPNQIIEIRDLIRSLGANRTVILSTHYLQEVEATCDHIIIVAGGRIVADGSSPDLCSKLPAGPLTAQIVGPADKVEQQLGQAFPGAKIDRVPTDGDGSRYQIAVPENMDRNAREALSDLVQGNNWKLLEMYRRPASLEQVFRRLTANGAQLPTQPAPQPPAAESPVASTTGGDRDA